MQYIFIKRTVQTAKVSFRQHCNVCDIWKFFQQLCKDLEVLKYSPKKCKLVGKSYNFLPQVISLNLQSDKFFSRHCKACVIWKIIPEYIVLIVK